MDNRIKKTAITAAQNAGKLLSREYDKFRRQSVELKSKHEIVTRADLISEKYILSVIRKNFPDHQILSEESGLDDGKSDYLWVVDPLDGTTNFSIHLPIWSVSIGVFQKRKTIFGVVYAPVLNELYVAEKGRGATLNGRKISVSRSSTVKNMNTFCHGSRQRDIRRAVKFMNYQKLNQLDCRQLGSAAIELGYVAAGRTESIMIPGAHPWDVAAGILLVREAGGRVTDFAGKRWNLESEDMLASNGGVHGELLRIINQN